MLDLFPDTVDKTKDGATWQVGNWHCRNWHGFLQSREGDRGNWCFQVHGFAGPEDGDGTAWVYTITGQEPCPIDKHNRILINGKRYGRAHWNH